MTVGGEETVSFHEAGAFRDRRGGSPRTRGGGEEMHGLRVSFGKRWRVKNAKTNRLEADEARYLSFVCGLKMRRFRS